MGHELDLRDVNSDTGAATQPGEYHLADKTYSKLLRQLAKDDFACVTPELRENILAFYSAPTASDWKTKNKKTWRDTAKALEQLRLRPTSAGPGDSCQAK